MSSRSFSLMGLWPVILRWRNLILLAVTLALVVSALVAWQMPNVYRSTSIFYPTNPESTDPDRIVEEGGRLALGGRAEDLDRIITIGQSQPVAAIIIKRYNLYEHYEAGKPGTEKADQAVLDEYTDNLSIVHSNRDAIELAFHDTDKVRAANIANTLVQVIDSINQRLTMENRGRIITLYRNRTTFLEKESAQVRDSLEDARQRYGIFGRLGLETESGYESRYLAKELAETETELRRAEGELAAGGGSAARVAGLRRAMRGLTQADGGNIINLENYLAGADLVTALYMRYESLQERLVEAQATYENARLAISSDISSIYVVQKAYPATREAKPVRPLIVLSAMFITFALSVIFITLLELYRNNLTLMKPKVVNRSEQVA
ncbi:hypothetical protein [Hymenobacter qilianensis]|uniref:Polysaccharide chain length determinant N-terminal domain-containing protein n=2 Tax=Hymenobacter qilianensis TaxID=1385715 RepID=A0A7H0GVH6_9BACT|nr:hypothetical protein [Hymenobacter qilianensis]QNP52292.1 hypothetical protein H9L05_00220 [Hymenobacter qilianensis]